MANSLQGAIVWTDDIKRLLPFYRDLLGFKPQFEGDGFVAFEGSGGPQLGLGRHSDVSGNSKDPFRMMLNVSVEDCQVEYERLKAEGVEFIREPSPGGRWPDHGDAARPGRERDSADAVSAVALLFE